MLTLWIAGGLACCGAAYCWGRATGRLDDFGERYGLNDGWRLWLDILLGLFIAITPGSFLISSLLALYVRG